MAELTELEGCVLALIASYGDCTAYRLRRDFQESLAANWRASTGSIYPLVRRLEKAGLVATSLVGDDGRGSRRLKATPAGRKAVRRWIEDDDVLVGNVVPDPIRTRLIFLSLLSAEAQSALVAKAIAEDTATLEQLDRHIATLSAKGERIEVLAHEGARVLVAARLKWLSGLREGLPFAG